MTRFLNKLSALKVARFAEPGLYCDGGGLWLQVAPALTKSWVFRFGMAGKRHHMGLGSLRDVSLAEARGLAADLGKRVRAGENPLAARRAEQDAARGLLARRMTFSPRGRHQRGSGFPGTGRATNVGHVADRRAAPHGSW